MSTRYRADEYAEIARIMKENEAERLKNLMGQPLEETKEPEAVWSYCGEAAIGWPFTAYDIAKA